jgi:hypothetical protein
VAAGKAVDSDFLRGFVLAALVGRHVAGDVDEDTCGAPAPINALLRGDCRKKPAIRANRMPPVFVPVLGERSRFTYYVSALLVRIWADV